MRVLSLITALILVNCLYSCSTGISKDVKNQVVTNVETITIQSQTVERSHQIPSTLIAQNRADLSFQLSGTVNQVLVKIGEKVVQGQALMSLYNPNLDPTLASNLAQLESIKAQIYQTKRDLKSLKELRKNHSTSKNAYEQKETQLKDFQAKQKSIEAQIELAEANQSESIITAPFDSTVVSVKKQLGEFVAAGHVALVVNQQEILETEVNLTKSLWKNISIGESVAGIVEQQKYIFDVIEKSQTADPSSRLFKVILQLQGKLDNVVGQQVTLRIPEKYPNVYQLPLETIVDDGINDPYIFLVSEAKAIKQKIFPLFIQGNHIIFSSSEPINLPIVVKGQTKISNNTLVNIINDENLEEIVIVDAS